MPHEIDPMDIEAYLSVLRWKGERKRRKEAPKSGTIEDYI